MKTRTLWKCPACGCLAGQSKANNDSAAAYRVFTRGALGIEPQVMVQRFLGGRGIGTRWDRRPMSREELERVRLACAKALQTIGAMLDDDTDDEPATPETVLAGLDDNMATAVCAEWLRDAEQELERRRQVVSDELERRGL